MNDPIDFCKFRLVKKKFCKHPRISVDEKRREITCDTCEAVLDPFELIVTEAHREENLLFDCSRLKTESKRLGLKLQKLQKIEKRIKARVYKQITDRELKLMVMEFMNTRFG